MLSRSVRISAGILCLCLVVEAGAQTESSWISDVSGIWDHPDHWEPVVPDATIDAKHLKMFSHIQVTGWASCLSFEGTSGVVDRFLLITSGHILTPREGGLHKSTGPGTPLANFVVKMENGAAGDETIVSVDGVTDGIDFIPAPKQKGDYLRLALRGEFKNSSVSFGDNGDLYLDVGSGDITSTSIAMGDDALVDSKARDVVGPGNHTVAWSFGDSGTVNVLAETGPIGGNVEGVDMTFGTSAAKSDEGTIVNIHRVGRGTPIIDDWLLRGFANVTVDQGFTAADESATIVLEDSSKMSIGSEGEHGTWVVRDSASLAGGW